MYGKPTSTVMFAPDFLPSCPTGVIVVKPT